MVSPQKTVVLNTAPEQLKEHNKETNLAGCQSPQISIQFINQQHGKQAQISESQHKNTQDLKD